MFYIIFYYTYVLLLVKYFARKSLTAKSFQLLLQSTPADMFTGVLDASVGY